MRVINFISNSLLCATENVKALIDWAQISDEPFGIKTNRFDSDAWSISGLTQKGGSQKFIYFSRLGFNAAVQKGRSRNGTPAEIPECDLLSEPFRSFAKALMHYLFFRGNTSCIPVRIIALRYVEKALSEQRSTCPTVISPEIMSRALHLASESVGGFLTYNVGQQLELCYHTIVELKIAAIPSDWKSFVCPPPRIRSRVGLRFDIEREAKLPSPLALEALADIFNTDTIEPIAVFASSLCALMLCSPDRSVEALYAPLSILAPDWTDPVSGEKGTGLRWFPVKGGLPMTKTVIPSMREVAMRAVERLKNLSNPARILAIWYEKNPNRIYLPLCLEYLRVQNQLNQREIYSILFGGEKVSRISKVQSSRTAKWLDKNNVPRISGNGGTTVTFAELERAVLATLPEGFPVMDQSTKMRYSEALCIIRKSEFRAELPSQVSFERIGYEVLKKALKSAGANKSIFEKLGYRDVDGRYLSLTSHMLRHYLNTLVRRSGKLSEDEIAKWSGRKSARQNHVYNHESDRDLLAKLRSAVGAPSLSVGPFANIDKRIFIRREEFASIKIITAHTTEIGYCVHDYAQTPCQVHQDCINCDEQVCIKGDARAEQNLRRMQAETSVLQEKARLAFDEGELGTAEWFQHQSRTLERLNELINILDDITVPNGAVIQLGNIIPPSRVLMADARAKLGVQGAGQSIKSIADVQSILENMTEVSAKDGDGA